MAIETDEHIKLEGTLATQQKRIEELEFQVKALEKKLWSLVFTLLGSFIFAILMSI